MRRACPRCLMAALEDAAQDLVACAVHGRLNAWLVLSPANWIVAAGRAGPGAWRGAAWLPPATCTTPAHAAFGEPGDALAARDTPS